ncbi:ATP-binding protein [Desertibaculum subflavum]|uniref:ATP-binding protein n=1 Tax=Desertibaculum subflavum TaxID=2268458 RepID=UPI000E6623F1
MSASSSGAASPAPPASPLPVDFRTEDMFGALEGMIQGIVIHRGKALYANQAMIDLVGIASREEYMRAPSVIDFVYPEDQELVRRQSAARIATGETQAYEFRLSRPDGTYIWVDARATAIQWGGEPAAMAVLTDISARKRSELLFHTIFQSSPDAITLSSLETLRYEMVNESFLKLHGKREDEVIGRTSQELGLVMDPTFRARVAALLREGKPVSDLVTEIRGESDKKYRQFSISGGRLTVDGRQMLMLVCRDVTDRHRQEEELREARDMLEKAYNSIAAANDSLEQRVLERTAELQEAQGELLKRERLSALGQLTATVAHELRNPLSAIKNTLFSTRELAAAKGLSLDRPIARMERSIERCNGIISDLLDFSKHRELSRTAAAFDAWLEPVVRDQSVPAEVSLSLTLGAADANVDLDADRLRRVVINLIDNAAQAMCDPQAKCAERRLALATRLDDGWVELVVADTGPGIAPENLAKVFEPLFSTKSFGTGLGLPTVKQIVEQHGGTIAIDSEVGRGTRVAVRLPRATARELAA